LVFDNHTDDDHPVHLHRNSFELTSDPYRQASVRRESRLRYEYGIFKQTIQGGWQLEQPSTSGLPFFAGPRSLGS
jgi:hypothetical protein